MISYESMNKSVSNLCVFCLSSLLEAQTAALFHFSALHSFHFPSDEASCIAGREQKDRWPPNNQRQYTAQRVAELRNTRTKHFFFSFQIGHPLVAAPIDDNSMLIGNDFWWRSHQRVNRPPRDQLQLDADESSWSKRKNKEMKSSKLHSKCLNDIHKCIIRYALSEKKPQYGVEELRVFVISIGRWEKSPMPINYEMIISPNIGHNNSDSTLRSESFIISLSGWEHLLLSLRLQWS